MVFPPRDITLDGKNHQGSEGGKPMYLDPFQSAEEVPIDRLQTQLSAIGVVSASYPKFLEGSTTAEIILRSANNIMVSVQNAHQNPLSEHTDHRSHHQTMLSSFPDLESAFFGALWALVLVCTPSEGDGSMTATFRQRQVVPFVVEHLQTYFPRDVVMIEHYVLPLYQDMPELEQLRETVRVIRAGDMMPKQVKVRSEEVNQHVKHKVGQVFRHRRYVYLAIITGWDVECSAGQAWMDHMHVDQLSHGRQQSFYHVLYVACIFPQTVVTSQEKRSWTEHIAGLRMGAYVMSLKRMSRLLGPKCLIGWWLWQGRISRGGTSTPERSLVTLGTSILTINEEFAR